MIPGINGFTEKTPENIAFGAGTIHRGLKYTDGKWNFAESCVGTTSEGSKWSVTPEITPIQVDGVWVPMKGMMRKTGEKATMELSLAEVTKEIILAGTLGKEGVAEDAASIMIESKADITDDDYWDNVAFVGKTLKGKPIIVIMDNALCTSGFPFEGKDKTPSVTKLTFECHADDTSDGASLPWRIIYPDQEVA